MNTRLHQLRKTLKLNQEDFGKRLGVTGASISRLEKGERNITEQMILSVCREFNVDEEWLRNGDGEMFLPPNDELGDLVGRLVADRSSEFSSIILDIMRSLDQLDDKGKEIFCRTVEDMAERIVKRKKEDD